VDGFSHPDALRRFRTVENLDELKQALAAPWEKWAVFLHPSQSAVVQRDYAGPARVAGSAGTGKTVVALHRAVRLAQGPDPAKRVLLTTFSRPLATALERKLKILAGPQTGVVPRITVAPLREFAAELYQLEFGLRPRVAAEDQIRSALAKAAEAEGLATTTPRFLLSEWTHVVDAWQLAGADDYASVPRLGRKSRIGAKQRDRLWPVFAATRRILADRGLSTWPQLLDAVRGRYLDRRDKPFAHVVVDEAQDLGIPELRFLAAIAPDAPNALFFAGDVGQRIFQQPFSWKGLGVDVRGRSSTLKVNYRTSHQIRQVADQLVPAVIRDVDGVGDNRTGTVSVFNGPAPTIMIAESDAEEINRVAAFFVEARAEGITPPEMGIFVRSADELPRARAAAEAASCQVLELSEHPEEPRNRVSVGTMHLAKGLEFKAVAVMACDDEVLPLQSRLEAVADEVELEEVYATERHLLYVACTRARDRLLVTGLAPGSEFIKDLKHSSF
jgi:superfamily I DNA/RNA helicase